MKRALSPDALGELREFCRARPLLAFDLDGTLAPLAARPGDAVIPVEVQHLLAVLGKRTPVAIVTGRAVSDARRMLASTPRYVIGSHGAEGVPGDEAAAPGYAALCRGWSEHVERSRLRERIPGVLVEYKTYSLALHYRLAADPEHARGALESLVRELSPAPRVVPGKCVLNLVPAAARHKGEALRALIAHAGVTRALYIGDDVTDEDVFALRLPGVRTIRVEPDGTSAADLYLDAQSEVLPLLRRLAEAVAAAEDVEVQR